MSGAEAGPVGFVTGLAAEAKLLRPLGGHHPIALSGATAEGAERAVQQLLRAGVRAVVSFGVAAGLDPALRPGEIVLPERVVQGERVFATDPALRAWLGGRTGAVGGSLLHSDALVASGGEKRRLFEATGCAALDMESGSAARMADEACLPFAALRAVCDPAWRDLPPAAVCAIGADGRIDAVRLAVSLLRYPSQLPVLFALARDAAAARRALRVRTSSIH